MSSLFKVPIPASMLRQIDTLNQKHATDDASRFGLGLLSNGYTTQTPQTTPCPPSYKSEMLPPPAPGPPLRRGLFGPVSNESSNPNGYVSQTPHATSLWGGPVERNDRQYPTSYGSTMKQPLAPPPKRGLFSSVANETQGLAHPFFNRQMVHSTPRDRHVGMPQARSMLRPPNDSTIGPLGSVSGSGSVRSYISNNAECVERILEKAMSKFMRQNFKPELKNMAIEVANDLRYYAQEAAQEVVAEGSVRSRSHYSKHGSTWRSSRDPIQSILLSGHQGRQRGPSPTGSSSTFECCTERSESGVHTTFRIVERTMPPRKRSPSAESDNSDCINVPQTVRRRKLGMTELSPQNPSSTTTSPPEPSAAPQFFGTPKAEKLRNINQKKESKVRAIAARKTADTMEPLRIADTPCLRKQSSDPQPAPQLKGIAPKEPTRKRKLPIKKNSKKIITSFVAPTVQLEVIAVTRTRSGRNVKRTSFYQAPRRNIRLKPDKNDQTPDKRLNDSGVTVVSKTKKIPKKAAAERSAQAQTKALGKSTLNESAAIAHTRSGRAVKPIINYDESLLPIVTETAKKPPKIKAAKKGHPAVTPHVPLAKQGSADISTGTDFAVPDLNDLSFGGADFYIPEVTQSTRRAGAKKKTLNTAKALGGQTPPLLHFTASLDPLLMRGATPAQQTPDWQPSQRTGSEMKEFQKRKEQKKSKTKAAKEAKSVRRRKPTKAVAAAKKLLCASGPALDQLLAPTFSSSEQDSDDDDDDDC